MAQGSGVLAPPHSPAHPTAHPITHPTTHPNIVWANQHLQHHLVQWTACISDEEAFLKTSCEVTAARLREPHGPDEEWTLLGTPDLDAEVSWVQFGPEPHCSEHELMIIRGVVHQSLCRKYTERRSGLDERMRAAILACDLGGVCGDDASDGSDPRVFQFVPPPPRSAATPRSPHDFPPCQ